VRIRSLFQGALFCALSVLLTQNARAVSIAIASDSMAAAEPATSLLCGWGQMLPGDFLANISIQDDAMCGSSTGSFLNGSAVVDGIPGVHHWQNLLNSHPDYVLISFGWNDCGATDDRHCTLGQYSANLETMIEQARAIGIKPLLVTPPSNRGFSADGTLGNGIRLYADAMLAVATAENVPCFDLNQSLASVYQSLGPVDSQAFGYANTDLLHFGEYGASVVASMVADDLAQNYPELGPYTVPEPSALVLLAAGFIGMCACAWRRRKA